MLTSSVSIILGFSASIIFILGYFLWRNINALKQLKERYTATQADLENEVKRQQELQDEFSAFKSKLNDNSFYDELTGLPSRKIFEDRVKLALSQSQRFQLTFAVMFLDLDEFKMINDALGHDLGDELINEVAKRLQLSIRQVDTISRFAGDEFAFLLPQLAKAETAAYIAQRFLDLISEPFNVGKEKLYLTASVGIAVYPTDGSDTQLLIQHATNALHQAKSFGRNMYQFYRAEMYATSRRELLLSSGLRSESLYQEFLLYFRPQINTKSKKIVCMSALLNWRHADFGLISWGEFARLAENSGKIVAIGDWVMRNAAQHFLSWQEQGFNLKTISIQATLKQIENPHFIQKVTNLLQETKIEPSALTIELSEVSLITKIEQVEKMLHMFKHLGVCISLVHFGTGHLSLQHLRNLPINNIKIDHSFIKDVTVSKESEAIVKMIIALGQSLNITVIAEGVETMKQKQQLELLGCFHMQGPIFGADMPAEDINVSLTNKMAEVLS